MTEVEDRPGGVAPWSRDAERRHLTILFVDMAAATSVAGRLDPEDFADLLNAFHDTCSRVVARFGGYVAKNLVEGFCAYFGWPESYEHDAQRAVLTALELIKAVKTIPNTVSAPIQVHVGIATGEVVVGDFVAMDSARDHEVFGEIPNLAARLLAIASPDAVVVSAETYELIRHKFVCTDLGPKKLKGFDEPITVHQVAGPRALSLDFDARSETGLTPLINRTAEMTLLKGLWQQAAAGEGHVLLLTGDPGIGKSRLCAELRSSLKDQNVSSVSFQCSPLHRDHPLYPVIKCIAQMADLSDADPPDIKWRKLEDLFEGVAGDHREGMLLLATHLGVSIAAKNRPALVSPERQRMALHRLLTGFILMLARDRPVLITFEDLHWMDPTTGEFLDLLVKRIRERAVLLVLTFRPTFASPWHQSERQTLVPLHRLNRDHSAQFIDAFANTAELPEETVAQLIERSDGNALYIEELTAAVVGRQRTQKAGDAPDHDPRARSSIPATLQDSLLARIDQTSPPARELLQLCAVTGRRFSYQQISVIAGIDGWELEETLAELVQNGLLDSTGRSADIEYSFKHALIQDAAYSIILREKRQRLHARCAQALETHFPALCARDPAVVGRHHEIAGNRQAAAPYFLTAGQLAIERFALKEANTFLQKGLTLLQTLAESEWRNRQELRFRSLLGRVSIFGSGWAHPSVKHEYGRALELSKALGMHNEQVPLEWALTTYHLLRGEIRESVTGGKRVLQLAELAKDPDLLHVAHSALTIYQFYRGNFRDAVSHKDQALRFYRPEVSEDLQRDFGTDRRLQALRGAALAHWCLGDHQLAIDLDEKQRSSAMSNGRPFEYAYALTVSCGLHSLRRDAEMTYSFAEAAIKIAQDQGFSFLQASAENFRAIALALQSPHEDTLRQCDEALAAYQSAGNQMGISAMLAVMAEACGRMGQPERGLGYVDRALHYVCRSGERFRQPDVYRVKGELLVAANRTSDAKRCLSRALRLAQRQHAKTWELAAAVPLAQILTDQSELAVARKLLQPLCDKFRSSLFVAEQVALAEAICRSSVGGRA